MPLFKLSRKRILSRFSRNRPTPLSPIFYRPYVRSLLSTDPEGRFTDMPLPATDTRLTETLPLVRNNSHDVVATMESGNENTLIAEYDYHNNEAELKSLEAFWQDLFNQGYVLQEDDVLSPNLDCYSSDEFDVLVNRAHAGRDGDISTFSTEYDMLATNPAPRRTGPLKDRGRTADTSKFEEGVVKVVLGTVSGIVRAYNTISRMTCGYLSVPTSWINNFAFFPPAPFKHYYLSYIDGATQARVIGNAEFAYNRAGIRFEPVLDKCKKQHVHIVRRFIDRTEAVVVKNALGNYIVTVKVTAERPPEAPNSHKVILLANSNASDLGISYDTCLGLFLNDNHPNDYDLYMFDYSGYGLSSGKPSEKAVNADIRAVYDYILKDQNDPDLKIVLFGISIGTTVVADLAATDPPNLGGVVLVAPLTSGIRHVAGSNPPKKTASSDVFRILDKAPFIRAPVFCVHGLDDSMMPATNSAQIYAAVQNPVDPLYVPNASHLGVLFAPELVVRFQHFIETEIDFDYNNDSIHEYPSDMIQTTLFSTR